MSILTPRGRSFEREQARRIVDRDKEIAGLQAALQRATDELKLEREEWEAALASWREMHAAEKGRADAAVADLSWLMDYVEKNRVLPCHVCNYEFMRDTCVICKPSWRGVQKEREA